MSEPLEMGQARNVYVRERERFRRELVFVLCQYDSCPLSFEIKQHLRLRAIDLKPECLEQYRRDTAKLSAEQPPLVGNTFRIRSMCPSERPRRQPSPSSEPMRTSLPLNRLTYESTRRATTNCHVLAFERQLTEELDQMTQSIDQLTESNRHQWLRPSHQNRQRQYWISRYDSTGYSLPLHDAASTSTFADRCAFRPDEQGRSNTSQVQQFYEQYLATSSFLNKENKQF